MVRDMFQNNAKGKHVSEGKNGQKRLCGTRRTIKHLLWQNFVFSFTSCPIFYFLMTFRVIHKVISESAHLKRFVDTIESPCPQGHLRKLMDFFRIPHKNVIASASVALLIFLIGLWVNRAPARSAVPLPPPPVPATTTESVSLAEEDVDHDGLKSWEESLYGTNPKNPDTDGDGTNDGDEILQGRNPAKANTAAQGTPPNDTMTIIADPHFATSTTDVTGLRKEFFTKFLATQAQDIRETTYRDLIKGFKPEQFKPANELVDLTISSDNSKDALHAYANAFGVIITKYTSVKASRTEEEILADGLKTKNDATLRELQLPAIVYKNFSADLKALKTPTLLAQDQLLIVNGYDGMGRGLLGMLHLFSDPITGAGGYQAYTKSRIDVTVGYANVVSALEKAGVTFTKDEPGYLFGAKAGVLGATSQ
jgi:hypothetical protein